MRIPLLILHNKNPYSAGKKIFGIYHEPMTYKIKSIHGRTGYKKIRKILILQVVARTHIERKNK